MEIPPYFKGNSFALLGYDNLIALAESVDLALGTDDVEKNINTQLLCDKELLLNHKFAKNNPESVLPSEEDLCSPSNYTNEPVNLSLNVPASGILDSLHLNDSESGIHVTPWTVVGSRRNKKDKNDRCIP